MAFRNFWTIQNGAIASGTVSFEWEAGMSTAQRRRSCVNMHKTLETCLRFRALDISSASTTKLGVQLSAFNLPYEDSTVECYYQGSKVYADGALNHHLYHTDSLTAKKASKGAFESLNFKGQVMPMKPKTVFYDWLYLKGMVSAYGEKLDLSMYDCFTDVQAKVDIDACQARSVCLYTLMQQLDNFYLLEDIHKFAKWHEQVVEKEFENPEKVYTEEIDWYIYKNGENVASIMPSVVSYYNQELNKSGGRFVPTNVYSRYRVEEAKHKLAEVCVIYTDLLYDDYCAISELSRNYRSAVIVVNKKGYSQQGDYGVPGLSFEYLTERIQTMFASAVVQSVPMSSPDSLANVKVPFDVYLLSPATEFAQDITKYSSLYNSVVAMIGSSDVNNSEEWNESLDTNAYAEFVKFKNNATCPVFQYTAEDCDKLHAEHGYWDIHSNIITAYASRVGDTCWDLQAVCDYLYSE